MRATAVEAGVVARDRRDDRDAGIGLDDLDDIRRHRQERRALHHDVAAKRAEHGRAEAVLEPLREDGDEDHEPDADHQRGGGTRGARRVAHRVVARERAASCRRAAERPAEHASTRRTAKRAVIATAKKTSTAPTAMPSRRWLALPEPSHAVQRSARRRRAKSSRRGRREAREAAARQRGALAQRRPSAGSCVARRAGRSSAESSVTPRPTTSAEHDRARREQRRGRGQAEADGARRAR